MSEFMAIPALQHLRTPDITKFKLRDLDEEKAKLYMEGLWAQARSLEATLAPDQELCMTCWHGHERLQVLRVSMPSHNVVALECIDEDGETIQVTGHMGAITFSFRVVTLKEPVEPRRVGFEMPSR